MGLKVFLGFAREMAVDLTGLSTGELRTLRQHKVVKPELTDEGYRYSFQDLLILRVVRSLKHYGVKVKNIKAAHHYLQQVEPEKNLSSFKLYVRDDTRQILGLGPDPNVMRAFDQFGQLMASNLLTILPIGKELEETRQEVINFDRRLSKSLKERKVIPLSEIDREYGFA